MRRLLHIICLLTFAAFMLSCSTTRSLQDNEYRLAKNTIIITNDKDFNPSELTYYLKQQHKSWSPFQYVYNWTNGKGKGWDKLVQKIGVAPVVYNPDMVDKSIENLQNHLAYLGYYNSKVTSSVKVSKRNVSVTYKVHLGKRYPIKDVAIILPESGEFAQDFISDTAAMTIRTGSYLSEESLEAESTRSSNAMRNKGYFDFNKIHCFFEADTLRVKDSALL